MENLDKSAKIVEKVSNKIIADLEKLEFPTALAIVNLIFIRMTLSQDDGPNAAKAMAATFMHNVMNSIDEYYYSDEEESVH